MLEPKAKSVQGQMISKVKSVVHLVTSNELLGIFEGKHIFIRLFLEI
jgi:hypothetical protein